MCLIITDNRPGRGAHWVKAFAMSLNLQKSDLQVSPCNLSSPEGTDNPWMIASQLAWCLHPKQTQTKSLWRPASNKVKGEEQGLRLSSLPQSHKQEKQWGQWAQGRDKAGALCSLWAQLPQLDVRKNTYRTGTARTITESTRDDLN